MTELSPGATCFTPRTGDVPPIPSSHLAAVVEAEPVLMWVRHGRLDVHVDGVGHLTARAGEAVWVPAGVRHSAELAAGSVALPVLPDGGGLAERFDRALVVPVPPAWTDWLTHLVSRWFGLASSTGTAAGTGWGGLADLLGAAHDEAAAGDLTRLPPLPRSPGPRAVVQRLLAEPACDADLVELAARALTSPRTLQRQLREETGLALAQWRTAIRVDAAAAHLARGRGVEWTAHHVGYATLSGFTRAFVERMGTSPGRYAARAARPAPVRPLPSPAAVTVPAPRVPAGPATSWIAPSDGLLWVHRGSARITLGGRTSELREGDMVRLGRGLAASLETAEGSVVLPLGLQDGGPPVRPGSIRVTRLPRDEALELYLLHLVVANHFLLRPREHDGLSWLDLLPWVQPVPDEVPPHLATLVSTLIDHPADRRSLTEWSVDLGVDALGLRRDFAQHLGEPFERWRTTLRMAEARALMVNGHPPSAAARRLGYTHLSSFSKAFSTAHGVPPREWLRLESG